MHSKKTLNTGLGTIHYFRYPGGGEGNLVVQPQWIRGGLLYAYAHIRHLPWFIEYWAYGKHTTCGGSHYNHVYALNVRKDAKAFPQRS